MPLSLWHCQVIHQHKDELSAMGKSEIMEGKFWSVLDLELFLEGTKKWDQERGMNLECCENLLSLIIYMSFGMIQMGSVKTLVPNVLLFFF